MGLLLLVDLYVRSQDLSAHYTDGGVLPRDATALFNPLHMSVHLATGSVAGQALLFLMASLCAVALLLGFRTPMATCASWLLLSSLQARNPLVLHSSDDLLRLLLFWGLFVPLGARYSLDRVIRLAGSDGGPTGVSSVGTAALLLQVCLVYWCTAALKAWDVWWHEASAVYYALSIDQIVTPFGLWLLGFPELLPLLSRATMVLEILGPCLALVSWGLPWLRVGVVGAFFCFHLGLAACLDIGLFPYVSLAGWLVFVPGPVWERGRQWLFMLPGLSGRGRVAVSRSTSPPGPLSPGERGRTVPLQAGRWSQVLAGVLLVYVVVWNLLGFPASAPYARWLFPPYAGLVGHVLRLDQRWDMFSPYPSRADGWFVVPGRLHDGSAVELWTGARGESWEKPAQIRARYPNDRWWKFMESLYPKDREREAALRAYAGYVCRDWNMRHSGRERLATFQIVFMQETTLLDYQAVQPERKVLGEYACAALSGEGDGRVTPGHAYTP